MGRSESKKAFESSSKMGQDLMTNAKQSLVNTQGAVGKYGANLADYMKFGEDTFGKGGEYSKDLSSVASGVASAGSNAVATDLALNKLRTGANTASYAPTIAESRRAAGRELTDTMAKGDLQRLAMLAKIKSEGLDASKFPAQIQAMLYGTSTQGANSAQGSATEAAKTPGFWDSLANSLVGGIASVGAGFASRG